MKNHLLTPDLYDYKYLPVKKNWRKFKEGYPDSIIIHYTAGSTLNGAVRHLRNPKIAASAHIVIGRKGEIVQLVPFNIESWHAGRSSYKGRSGWNKFSIGIELDNNGKLNATHEGGKTVYTDYWGHIIEPENVHLRESDNTFWHTYSNDQIKICFDICHSLQSTYGINIILGHEEIAPIRKKDPGPAFPLNRLRDRITEKIVPEYLHMKGL